VNQLSDVLEISAIGVCAQVGALLIPGVGEAEPAIAGAEVETRAAATEVEAEQETSRGLLAHPTRTPNRRAPCRRQQCQTIRRLVLRKSARPALLATACRTLVWASTSRPQRPQVTSLRSVASTVSMQPRPQVPTIGCLQASEPTVLVREKAQPMGSDLAAITKGRLVLDTVATGLTMAPRRARTIRPAATTRLRLVTTARVTTPRLRTRYPRIHRCSTDITQWTPVQNSPTPTAA
jgi:hypothetical protein